MSRFSPGFLTGGAGTILGTLPTMTAQGAATTAAAAASNTPVNPATGAGNLFLALIAVTANKTIATVSAGWTMGGQVAQGNATIAWAWGFDGVVSGNCVFTWTGNAASVSRTQRFNNTRQTSPIGNTSGNSGNSNFAGAFGFTASHGMSLDYIASACQGINADTNANTGYTHISQNTSTGITLNQSRENAAVDPKGATSGAYTSKTSTGGFAWAIVQLEIMSIAVP